MKYFRMSYDEVVFKRSYLNLVLLNRAIPGIKPFNEDGEGEEDDDELLEFIDKDCNVASKAKGAKHASDFFMNFM